MLTVFNDYGNHYYGSGSLTAFMAGTGSTAAIACNASQSTYYHNGSYGAWALANAIFNSNDTADPAPAGYYSGMSGSTTTFVRYWDGSSLGSAVTCVINYFGWNSRNDGYATGGGGTPQAPLHYSSSNPTPFVGELTNWYSGAQLENFFIQLYTYNPGSYSVDYSYSLYNLNNGQTGFNTTPAYSSGPLNLNLATAPNQNTAAVDTSPITVGINQKCKVTLYKPTNYFTGTNSGYVTLYGGNGSGNNQYTIT